MKQNYATGFSPSRTTTGHRTAMGRLLLMTLLLFAFMGGARAQETLTIYDGTDNNSYVPFYGLYADTQGAASECVIPSDLLGDMAGGQITAMKFYLKQAAAAAWTGTHQVYLGEVDATTLTGITGPTNFTVVKTASFDATGTELTITFDSPYGYGGGNLLIGTYVSVAGNYKSAYFYGVNQTDNTSWYRKDASAPGSGVQFLPKTTFTYEPASTGCDMPTSIAVTNITPNSANVTWEGEGSKWNLRYKASTDADYTLVEGLTTKTYNLTGLAENTAYSVGVQTDCGGSTSSFRSISFTTANPCAAPTNLVVTDITPSSATLSWTAGYQETSWTVKYKKSTEEDFTVETVSGTPTITLSSLDGLTTYNVQVYNCTDEGSPYLSGNFTTAASFPYSQDFSASGIPTGWTQYTGLLADVMNGTALTSSTTGWSNGTSNGVLDGNNIYSNIYGTTRKNWIVTPAIPLGSNARITFDVAYTAYSGTAVAPATEGDDDKFVVLISTDNMATWTILRQWDNAGSGYVLNDLTPSALHLNFDLSAYAGQSAIVAFYAESTVSNADNNIHVDNVVFEVAPSCEKPYNVAVNYTGGLTAKVTWEGEASSYNIDVNGTVTEGVTSPYTLEGLELSTTYEVKVQAVCSQTEQSEWTNPVSFTTDMCLPEDQCLINITLTDSYSDGWNGGQLQVVDAGTGTVLGTFTLSSGGSGNFSLNVCNGREINFVYVQGNYPTENGWIITDVNDEVIAEHEGCNDGCAVDGGVIATHTVNCTVMTCKKPTDLAASEIGPRSAVLSWTPGSEDQDAWQICINGDEENLIDVTENPYTLTGLTPETAYTVKVRGNCGEEKSKWSADISFTTDIAYHAPTGVAATEITRTSATISWTGVGDSYNLRYRGTRGFKYGFETAEPWAVDNFAPCTTYDGDQTGCYGFTDESYTNIPFTGSTIAFQSTGGNLSSHTGNAFGMMISAVPNNYPDGITHSDDWFILPEITISEGDVFSFWGREITTQYGAETINVGIYGETDGTFAATLAENVEVGSTTWTEYSYDLSAYSGQTVRLAINYVSHDIFGFMFDDIFVGNPADDTWDETIANVTTPYNLENLNPSTEYEVEIQAVYTGEDAGESTWVGTSFTTKTGKEKPTDLAATEISATQATLGWTGYQDSYNVQYRTAEVTDEYYFTNFNTDADRDGWTWDGSAIYGLYDPIYGYSDDENYFLQMGWNKTEEATIVSPELPDYESGTKVEFYYFGYTNTNTFQVGFSTTTSDLDAFTWSEPIDAPLQEYTKFSEELPAGVKYVAFKATASAQSATVFIDNFRVYKFISPAGEWVSATSTEPTLTISGLTPETEYDWQVQGIYEGGTTEWVSGDSFTTEELVGIELVNDDTENPADKKNSVFIADNVGKYCEVTLSDRTLFKDDNWNTICLPFDVDLTAPDCPLDGATAKTLTNATVTKDESLTHIALTFGDAVTKLEAGVPYIIKWATDPDGKHVADPVFTDVLIKNVPAAYRTLSFAEGKVQFTGYYDAFAIATNDIFYMTADSKLKNGGIGRIMKSCRAYFQFSDDTSTAREFVLNFGDSEATGVQFVATESQHTGQKTYDLQGRRVVSSQSTVHSPQLKKGLYIQNGKKVVIK